MSSLSMRGRLRTGASRRPKVVFPLPGNPEITTNGLRIREVVRPTLFWIDTIDLTSYTVADGDGQTTAAREADGDGGGTNDLPRSAAHPFYTRLNQILD